MPQHDLFHGGIARWLSSGAILAVSAWLAVTHALDADGRGDRETAAVLGDDAGLGARLFDGPSGLSIRLDAAQRAALMRLIAAHPLNGSAIALLALDRQARGDPAGAAALGDQAIRIEPRTRMAWLARLDRQMRRRDTIAAAVGAMRLLAFDTRHATTYLPILAAVAKDPRTIPVISARLATNPVWRAPFVGQLIEAKVDPAIRYALLNPDRPTPSADMEGDRSFFLGDLTNRGDFERAYLAWLSFLPESAMSAVGTPYDASFAGLPGAAPFNWQLSATDGDQASIAGGALQLSYSGRHAATLARQIVLLEPGAYRLSSVVASADGASASGGTALTWNVRCLPANTPIAAFALDPKVIGRPQRSAPFVVPADCPAVALQIEGTASGFPVRLTMGIASVAIQRSAAVQP